MPLNDYDLAIIKALERAADDAVGNHRNSIHCGAEHIRRLALKNEPKKEEQHDNPAQLRLIP